MISPSSSGTDHTAIIHVVLPIQAPERGGHYPESYVADSLCSKPLSFMKYDIFAHVLKRHI